MNNVNLIGRLTKKPELATTTNGAQKTTFTLAVDREVKSNSTVNQDTDFIMCSAWNKTAELITSYLDKGSRIAVSGRINTYSYDNQQGQKVYITEVLCNRVEFLSPKTKQEQAEERHPKSNNFGYEEFYADTNDSLDISSDDLPF